MPRTKKSPHRIGGRRRGRPGKLASMTVDQLQAEIDRRQQSVPALIRERDAIIKTLDSIERELSSLGAAMTGGSAVRRGPGRPRKLGARRGPGRPPGRTGHRRPKNEMNLVESLKKVLTGKTMSVVDAVEAVQKAGYKTTSKTFRVIVNQALIANGKVFRKVARGQYTAR